MTGMCQGIDQLVKEQLFPRSEARQHILGTNCPVSGGHLPKDQGASKFSERDVRYRRGNAKSWLILHDKNSSRGLLQLAVAAWLRECQARFHNLSACCNIRLRKLMHGGRILGYLQCCRG